MVRGLNFYQKHFHEEEKSVRQIAREQDTHPEVIRREMKKLGIKSRSRDKAMELAKKHGRCKSPYEGGSVPEPTKEKISKTLKDYWEKKNGDNKGNQSKDPDHSPSE